MYIHTYIYIYSPTILDIVAYMPARSNQAYKRYVPTRLGWGHILINGSGYPFQVRASHYYKKNSAVCHEEPLLIRSLQRQLMTMYEGPYTCNSMSVTIIVIIYVCMSLSTILDTMMYACVFQ